MPITRESAVTVSVVEFKLWVLEHPECWVRAEECYDINQLLDTWETKYGKLTSSERMRFVGITYDLKETVLKIIKYTQGPFQAAVREAGARKSKASVG